MNTIHLTEEQIQLYVSDTAVADPAMAAHILSCETCRAEIASYQLLINTIREEKKPVFDFDLAALVMAKLPAPAPVRSSGNLLIYLMVLTGVLLAGAALYLLRDYPLSVLTGIMPVMIYLAGATLLILVLVLGFDMHRTYQKKMNALDFS